MLEELTALRATALCLASTTLRQIQHFFIELSEVEEVVQFELVVPCFACASLVQQQDFFTMRDAPELVGLDFPEERE